MTILTNENKEGQRIADIDIAPGFYKSLLDDMVTMVAVLDKEGHLLFVNNTPLIVSGFTFREVFQKKFWDTKWWTYSEAAVCRIKNAVEICASGEMVKFEIQAAKKDGTLFWVEFSMHPIMDAKGVVKYLVPEGRDVTTHKQQEEILRHSLKMEALGKLTAGIAHDYNNILNIIMGYTELIGVNVSNDHQLTQYISDIQKAINRGGKLARKLLAFTKQKASEVSTCNINHKLKDMQLMIEKTLTSQVSVSYHFQDDLWRVDVDEHDLEDCVVNICINSMHAMSKGGLLSVHTANVDLDEAAADEVNLEAGSYVTLSICDTGCGMDNATLEKVFDPFFTTKGDGGTGLGMSQVHGFVQRAAGSIHLASKIGAGTKTVIYFPKSQSQLISGNNKEQTLGYLNGNESLLIVDDETAITDLTRDSLTPYGYQVFTANDAFRALEILGEHPIDLVVSDVIMPNMDGYELASIIQERSPQTKIQLVSGFEDERDLTREQQELRKSIIYKPCSPIFLLQRLRKILDEVWP